jgi:hypothetical protein
VDAALLERLLSEAESVTLDFKEAPYQTTKDQGASDTTKAKLVKDILAFANTLRTEDAYILIGVKENDAAARADVVGVTFHPDDADLQQLINEKTNRHITFGYSKAECDGKSIGVIRIPPGQERPFFLKNTFGDLPGGVVFRRRGSSTVVASPDEVFKWGQDQIREQAPQVEVQFGNYGSRERLGRDLTLTSTILRPLPPPVRVNPGGRSRSTSRVLTDLPHVYAEAIPFDPFDKRKHKWEAKRIALFYCSLAFYVENRSEALVSSAAVRFRFPKVDGFEVHERRPEAPAGIYGIVGPPLVRPGTDVDDVGSEFEVRLSVGKVQPLSEAWSHACWVACAEPMTFELQVHLSADNMPPTVTPMKLRIEVAVADYRDDA